MDESLPGAEGERSEAGSARTSRTHSIFSEGCNTRSAAGALHAVIIPATSMRDKIADTPCLFIDRLQLKPDHPASIPVYGNRQPIAFLPFHRKLIQRGGVRERRPHWATMSIRKFHVRPCMALDSARTGASAVFLYLPLRRIGKREQRQPGDANRRVEAENARRSDARAEAAVTPSAPSRRLRPISVEEGDNPVLPATTTDSSLTENRSSRAASPLSP